MTRDESLIDRKLWRRLGLLTWLCGSLFASAPARAEGTAPPTVQPSATAAAADPTLRPPDEAPGESMLEPDFLLFRMPIVVSMLALGVLLTLHWSRTRRVARQWTGGHAEWTSLWGLPLIASILVFVVVCGAALVFAVTSSSSFKNYAQNQATPDLLWPWLIGLFVIWLIPLGFALRGSGRPASTLSN